MESESDLVDEFVWGRVWGVGADPAGQGTEVRALRRRGVGYVVLFDGVELGDAPVTAAEVGSLVFARFCGNVVRVETREAELLGTLGPLREQILDAVGEVSDNPGAELMLRLDPARDQWVVTHQGTQAKLARLSVRDPVGAALALLASRVALLRATLDATVAAEARLRTVIGGPEHA